MISVSNRGCFFTLRKVVVKMKLRNTTLMVVTLFCVVFAILFIQGFSSHGKKEIKAATTSPTIESDMSNQNQDSLEWNYIPEEYNVTLMTLKNDYQADERIYPDLQEMFDAARNENIYPLIDEAYRTQERQEALFSDKVNAYIAEGYSEEEAHDLAKTWVALPGASEHQLGLALDINAEQDKCTNDAVYLWLQENSYKYGFILRYPSDKFNITGINYEPWHFRYVGREAAKEIYTQELCLEEYLD